MTIKNPYILLGISEDASKTEIQEALKYKIEVFCTSDNESYNEYYEKLFFDAAELLLDCKKREKVDNGIAKLKKNNNKDTNNVPIYYDYFDRSKNEFITYINQEIFDKNLLKKFELMNRYPSSRQFGLDYMYSVIGNDKSFLITYAKDGLLSDVFTHQILIENEYTEPWKNGEIFKIRGIKSFAFPISKIVPSGIIDSNGYVLEKDMKNLKNAISYAIKENPEVVDSLFKSYQYKK